MKKMDRIDGVGSRLAVWLMAACVALLLSGCGSSNEASLTITEKQVEKGMETVVEYSGADGNAKGKVLSSVSSLTEHATYSGDFAKVYAALTGKEHSNPKSVTTVDQIIDAVEIGKWSIVADAKTEGDAAVRTINLRRNEAKTE